MALQYISLAYRSLAEAVKYGLENEDIVSVNIYVLIIAYNLFLCRNWSVMLLLSL